MHERDTEDYIMSTEVGLKMIKIVKKDQNSDREQDDHENLGVKLG